MHDTAASVSRIRQYLERRQRARGIDVEEIHAFDASPEGGFFLRVSDLEALLSAVTAPQTEPPAPELLDEDAFVEVLNPYIKAAIAEHEWASIAPVGMTKKQAAKEQRLLNASEKAWNALWNYMCANMRPSRSSDAAAAKDFRQRVMRAIFDPGRTEGYKGDRDLTTWQTDAVMRAIGFPEGVK
jgi:hypothetical protein